MNKKTLALTTEQYREIISAMRKGFAGSRPNDTVATALMLEANLGLRISDILRLKNVQLQQFLCGRAGKLFVFLRCKGRHTMSGLA